MSAASSESSTITFIVGGWLVGTFGDLVLQGILLGQFGAYFALYKKDTPVLRSFVGVLFLATTLKSLQVAFVFLLGIVTTPGMLISGLRRITSWRTVILFFADFDAAMGYYASSPFMRDNLLFVALIAFLVQMLFTQRLWIISRNVWIAGFIAMLFTFGLVCGLLGVVLTELFDPCLHQAPWIPIHLGMVFGGDFILCTTTSWFLLTLQRRSPSNRRHAPRHRPPDVPIRRPAAICALVNLLTYIGSVQTQCASNGSALASIAANQVLPKLYAVSAMWTLNARRRVRLSRTGNTSSSQEVISLSGGRHGGRRGTSVNVNNVELAGMGMWLSRKQTQTRTQNRDHGQALTIQVHTQVHTHIDHDELTFAGAGPKAKRQMASVMEESV
uniref:DUF4203 domain-containing protein n=1 Tax=Mycena chlorophos TaxID=658473 RepID=A0ABQ0L0L6_MYCCL|nr:predicted protein [Mycena chlorophos]